MCGEKCPPTAQICERLGSPPRVRGEELVEIAENAEKRITPACAGRSNFFYDGKSCMEDHPRVCGEKGMVIFLEMKRKGSPPRVRGEARALAGDHTGWRITPACAGRSTCTDITGGHRGDHPRVCGEKTKKIPNISRFYPGAACFSFSFS